MHPRSIPVFLTFCALAGCGSWSSTPASDTTAPSASSIPDDPNRSTMPVVAWQELPREDARLRGLVRDALQALRADDPTPLEQYLLTSDALTVLRTRCGGTITGACLPDAPDMLVRDVVLDDATHATIHTLLVQDGSLVDGPALRAELTRDGARLTGLPQ